MGSFFYEESSVAFSGSLTYNATEQRILPYAFDITELPPERRTNYYRPGQPDEERYSVYGAQVSSMNE